MSIPNSFYTFLLNSDATSLGAVPAADWVSPEYREVIRHPTVDALADALLGKDLIAKNYTATQIRLMLPSSPLEFLFTSGQLYGGRDLAQLAIQQQDSFTPQMRESGRYVESVGKYTADRYVLTTLRVGPVSPGGDSVEVFDSHGSLGAYPIDAGRVQLPVFGNKNVRCILELADVPGTLQWAARPRLRIDQVYQQQLPLIRTLAVQFPNLATTFSPPIVQQLVGIATSDAGGLAPPVAAAVLIVSHTAARAQG